MKKILEQIDGAEKQGMPELGKGVRLEVVTPENKLIFVGVIEWAKKDVMQIVDVTGADVPVIPYNSPVKLRGFYHSHPIFLEGQIGGSTQKFWRIDRLKALQLSEQRGYFRQNISREAKVACINEVFGIQKSDEGSKELVQACKVANISATGVLILSHENFQEGDWLRLMDLELVPGEKTFMLTCVVRRVTHYETGNGYGCEFYKLSSGEQDRLIRSILVLQRKERQARQTERD